MYLQSKSCGGCGRTVSLSANAGDRCPHCGAYWAGVKTRAVGGSTASSASGSGWVGAVIWIVILVVAAAAGKGC